MKNAKLKAELLKEYEDNKAEFKSPTASVKRNKWLDKVIKEYYVDSRKNI